MNRRRRFRHVGAAAAALTLAHAPAAHAGTATVYQCVGSGGQPAATDMVSSPATTPALKFLVSCGQPGVAWGLEVRGGAPQALWRGSSAQSDRRQEQRASTTERHRVGRLSPNGSATGTGDRVQGTRLEAYFGTRHKWCYLDADPSGPGAADPTSCVSAVAEATHHIKNWYFSNTIVDGRRRTYSTWVTSYNLTRTSNRQFNDAFVVNGNHDLYTAYTRSFASFYNQARSDDLYSVAGRGNHVVPSANVEISYAPQKTGDQVAAALSRIDRYEHGCRLKVANLSLAASRKALIRRLVRIKRLGCRVQVAYSSDYGQAASRLLAEGIEVRTPNSTQIHSKMMVYRGRYDGRPNRTLVWGGSHNLTGPSLRRRDECSSGSHAWASTSDTGHTSR
jgi:hypothetical protein